jgi:hypothetical protein
MTSAKIARAHNRMLKQKRCQKRTSGYISPFQQFIQFVRTNSKFEDCYCDRGIELAKEMLKYNRNIEQVAYKCDAIICDELYEIVHPEMYS